MPARTHSGTAKMHNGRGGSFRAVDWLALAATPTFALMALLTAVIGDGHSALLCSQAEPASPLSGMAPMYLLMAAFHLVPWFRLAEGARGG